MAAMELTDLKGIGPATARAFAGIGIRSVADLLHYYPRKHNDFSYVLPIAAIKPGTVTIKARIKQASGRYVRRGMHITEAVASDKSGSVRLVWFNQPYRAQAITAEAEYYITGKLELRQQRLALQNPSLERADDVPIHTARIVPVYREAKGISSKQLRSAIAAALTAVGDISEVLPGELCRAYQLMPYRDALHELHFPSQQETLAGAKRTMAFIELFELMLASGLAKQKIAVEKAPVIALDERLAKDFTASLPFKLTDAQRQAAWQVLQDMQKPSPMNRLLEGDVGSGKTVVAAMAAMMAIQAGFQAAFIAPTELLARQHAQSLSELLKPVGLVHKLGLLTGSLSTAQKQLAKTALKNGSVSLVIGTHALLQENVDVPRLGLLIIDEQHRFGVEQRKKLLKRYGQMPHVLSMTATPIPRSLALTLYGDLDISLLDALPPGRKPIKTIIVSPNSRDAMHEHISSEISKGRQVYVVCPVITEGTALKSVSAEATYERLRTKVFQGKRIGLLHGRQKSDEKSSVMEQFNNGDLDILVATTVIEVGVNVPNATIMVIEGADRFGLAQLHQLRGRVGRSTDQGYCYLVPGDSKPPGKRLRALEQSTDGFKLAEYDLELRGPGAIYGTLQHGALDLRFARFDDHRLIAEARQAVKVFMAGKPALNEYPELYRRVRLAQAVVTLN